MSKAAPKEKPKTLVKVMAENRLRKNPFASVLTPAAPKAAAPKQKK